MLKKTNIFLLCLLTVIGSVIASYLFIIPVLYSRETVIVPDLIGLDHESGTSMLEKNGLIVITERVTADEDDGKILHVNPIPGSKVKKDTVITISIAQKAKVVRLNDYTNRYYTDLEIEIQKLKTDYNIEVIIIEEKNNNYIENIVIKQLPAQGTLIKENDYIIFYVSSFDEGITIPDFKGWSLEKVSRFEADNQVFFEYKHEYSDTILENHVIAQSVEKGSSWLKNSKSYIVLTISKGKPKTPTKIPDFVGISVEQAKIIADVLNIATEYDYQVSLASPETIIEQIYLDNHS
ncbi:MAG: PASTA domain-containing protein [Erysipelotrichales bacterium]|nr:PASTA domain-containing protein [Erysipelotrichales bacterium]